MKFKTTILQIGNNTGIGVRPEIIKKLVLGKTMVATILLPFFRRWIASHTQPPPTKS